MAAPDAGTSSALGEHSLLGLDGRRATISSLAGPVGTVVVFIANGCPTARSYENRLVELQAAWGSRDVNVVAVNSNNPYLSPPDTVAEMAGRARRFNFPYLKDEQSDLAKRLGAICTPHAFLFDGAIRLVYSGRIDDSRVGDRITRRDLDNALEDLAAGQAVAVSHTEPFGCSIVW
jgi:hypothetical protein